jgi:hypothetical protein
LLGLLSGVEHPPRGVSVRAQRHDSLIYIDTSL